MGGRIRCPISLRSLVPMIGAMYACSRITILWVVSKICRPSLEVSSAFFGEIHEVEQVPDAELVITLLKGIDLTLLVEIYDGISSSVQLRSSVVCQLHQTDAEPDPPFHHLTPQHAFVLTEFDSSGTICCRIMAEKIGEIHHVSFSFTHQPLQLKHILCPANELLNFYELFKKEAIIVLQFLSIGPEVIISRTVGRVSTTVEGM